MKSQTIRLLIVDDHPVVLAGLRSLSQAAPDITVVGEAVNAEQAGAAAATGQPDVALVDIRLGDESGVDLCRQLKAQNPALRVLFLTSFIEDELILAGVEAGTDGYLVKDGNMDRLAAAIREVAQGGTVLDREVARRLMRSKTGKEATEGQGFDSLTERERRLLAEVARGRTDKQAAAALGLTFKTARNYLDRIFAKLGVHNRTEAALIYARHQGARGREGSGR